MSKKKALVKFYRVARVPTAHLLAAVGLDTGGDVGTARERMKEKFAPFAPGLAIFWQENPSSFTICGMEAMSFSVEANQVPCAGITSCDPCTPKDVDQMDGALKSELSRFGVWVAPDKDFEWRLTYELSNIKDGEDDFSL